MFNAIAFDPSSTCTGWAYGENDKVIRAGFIKPKSSMKAIRRIQWMVNDTCHVLRNLKPSIVVIEEASGKIHGRIKKSNPSGLSVYGMAVGAVYATSVLHGVKVVTYKENEWTHGRKKATRQVMAQVYYQKYKGIKEFDTGMDISDAICLLTYFYTKQRIERLKR